MSSHHKEKQNIFFPWFNKVVNHTASSSSILKKQGLMEERRKDPEIDVSSHVSSTKVGSLPTIDNSSLIILLPSLDILPVLSTASDLHCFGFWNYLKHILSYLLGLFVLSFGLNTCCFKVRPILSPSLFSAHPMPVSFHSNSIQLPASAVVLCSAPKSPLPHPLGTIFLTPKLLPTCIGFQSITEKNRFSKPLSAHSLWCNYRI